MEAAKKLLNKITIRQILFFGFSVRLLAVFFSPGYAFHDDHFEMAELVFKWKNGLNFLWTGSNVHVFSLIYPGIIYLLFDVCRVVGINQPEDMMFVVRLIHALISLLSIYYAYLLTLRLTDKKNVAIVVALAIAFFWIFPFMSVRTLREFFCIPFCLIGCYYIADPKLTYRSIFLAAIFFALSFCIRLQIIFIPFGIGLCLLFNRRYIKRAIVFGIAFVLAYMLTQGLFDFIYYGDPFASAKEYMRFNSDPANIHIQPQGPWYKYIITITVAVWGFPFLLLALGYIYSFRMSFRIKIFFVASLLFFVFHSYYSNKQERFILPFIPFFILLGIIGFREYYVKHINVACLTKTTKFILIWFLIFNTIGLLVLTFSYPKRSRIEAMIYLRKKRDVTNIIMEGDASALRPPLFYLSKNMDVYLFPAGETIDQLQTEIKTSGNTAPNYMIMAGKQNFDQRLTNIKKLFPDLKQETSIPAGFVDGLAYWLNPKNNPNEDWYIYKLK